MKRLLRTSVVIAAGFLLASCTPPRMHIAVSRVDGRQLASLTQDWGRSRRREIPCVIMIDLRGGDGGMNDQAWRVVSEGRECVLLSGFTIGQVPAGFVEVTRLSAQSRGKFRLIVSGIGTNETQISLP
jgi:hypothetical protein